MEQDMENYIHHKLMEGRIIMKAEVVPHIFDCQPDRKRTWEGPASPAALKRVRRQLVQDAMEEYAFSEHSEQQNTTVQEECVSDELSSLNVLVPSPSTVEASGDDLSSTLPVLAKQVVEDLTPSKAGCSLEYPNMTSIETEYYEPQFKSTKSIGIQTKQMKVHVRSKSTQVEIKRPSQHAAVSPFKLPVMKQASTSPFKIASTTLNKPTLEENIASSSSHDEFCESGTSFTVTATDTDFKADLLKIQKEKEKQNTLKVMCRAIQNKPKSYTGITKPWFTQLIDLLEQKTGIKRDYIYLTLMKIKLNDSFSRLADQFGMTISNVSKIFSKSVVLLDQYIKSLIYWPPKDKIRELLPIPFRARYGDVQSIIDCFEIQIEKPSDPEKQALTWSEYKKCNTLKYLISSTPDGFISFVSKGYGGRISDMLLLEDSGYLDVLASNCSVMADRGFKHIEGLLKRKNCRLVKPPSVASGTKLSRAEVIETKRIASLRIHIERVIRRLRESAYLKPHAVINHDVVAYTDSVVNIACGLINLQSPIIR